MPKQGQKTRAMMQRQGRQRNGMLCKTRNDVTTDEKKLCDIVAAMRDTLAMQCSVRGVIQDLE
jgi:hypothetical protein